MKLSTQLRLGGFALIVGVVSGSFPGVGAFQATPEERCQIAKAKANWKWHRCRTKAAIKELKGRSSKVVERLIARCDEKHMEAFHKAEQEAQQEGAGVCIGHSEVVRGAILGSSAPILGAGPSRDNIGVNIFGLSGFENQQAMIATLFQQGVRKFRVINSGGWPDRVYNAINEEAKKLLSGERAKVSVYVPSQYFAKHGNLDFSIKTTKAKFANWPYIQHWIIQLDACDPITPPVQCGNPTEAGLSVTNTPEYIDLIKKAIPEFLGQSYRVEFVIPYQKPELSPDSKLDQVKQATVNTFPRVRFTLEKTEYPFWGGNSTTNTNFPFDAANTFYRHATDKGFDGGYFAESGWPRNCSTTVPKHAPANLPNQCAYLKSLLHGTFAHDQFVVYWFLMGTEQVDVCGADSWGLFKADATLACPASF